MRAISLGRWGRITVSRGVVLFLVVTVLQVVPALAAAASRPSDFKRPTVQRPAFVPGEVIVQYRSGVGPSAAAAVEAEMGLAVKEVLPLGAGRVLRLPAGAGVERMVAALQRRPEVLHAQPNYLYYPDMIPNDPGFANLWGLHNTGQTVNGFPGTADVDIDAPEAWDVTRDVTQGNGSLVVAVIDTGVDFNHPDLAGRIWTNPGESGGGKETNGQDDDGNGYVDDVYGWDFYNNDNTVFHSDEGDTHGTHVAGTIAAAVYNGVGVAGVADVKIMPLKFLGGPNGSGTTVDAVKAINYAKSKGVKIANNSWGGGGYDPALYNAIRDSGIVFVAAAGNDGQNNDDPSGTKHHYPSDYDLPNILSVAAVVYDGTLASFSNRGTTSIDVGAPGVNIYSTYPKVPAAGGAAIAVTDSTYGYRSVTWGFGLEDIQSAADQADAMGKTLGGVLGLPTGASILLVDDDENFQGNDFQGIYTAALSAAGYTYGIYMVTAGADGPSSVVLAAYDGVVWFTGRAFSTSGVLTANDQSNLIAYLRSGGKLFLSGEDAALGIESSTLYRDFLKTRVIREYGANTSVRWTDQVAGSVYAGTAYAFTGTNAYRDVFRSLDPNAAKVALEYVAAPDYSSAYAFLNGTSMATPHATGVAALVWSHEPQLTVDQVVYAVYATGTPLASLAGTTRYGRLVNARAALEYVNTPPAAPTGLSAAPQAGGSIRLNWTASPATDLAGYNIYRNGTKINGATVIGTTYDDTAVTDGTTYTYTVKAVDKLGALSADSNTASATADASAPSSPSVVINGGAAATNSLSVTLGLGATDVVGVVYMSVYNDNTFAGAVWEPYTTSKAWTLAAGPDGARTVYAKFRDAAGNVSTVASDSIAYDTTAPSAPTGLSASPGNASVTLSWTAATDNLTAVTYTVYKAVYDQVSGAGPFSLVAGGVSGLNYTVSGLTNGTTYAFYVGAVDAAGNVSATVSNTVYATPQAPAGGGGGGGGGGGAPPTDEDQEKSSLDAAGGSVDAFEGEVEIDVPAGTFDGRVDLTVRRLKEEKAPAGFTAAGPVYDFDAGGSALKKPVTVRIKYDPARLGGADPRKLGLYRQDDRDRTRWTYVGGRVDRLAGVVEATLDHFSRYAVLAPDKTFVDVRGHWARNDIEVLVARGVVSGVDDREYRPEQAVTRAELAKLLVEVLIRDPARNMQRVAPSRPTFRDVAPGGWDYVYVETAARYGLAKGEGGRFRPGDPVTREEMAAMIVRALGLEKDAAARAGQVPAFADGSEVSAWARGYVALAREQGLAQGLPGGRFAPGGRSTRAQAASLILRTMERMGMVEAASTLQGTVRVSEIEGRHFELETPDGRRYVLTPVGDAVARLLEANAGKVVRVTGTLQDGPNIYMRGPVLRVTAVEAGS